MTIYEADLSKIAVPVKAHKKKIKEKVPETLQTEVQSPPPVEEQPKKKRRVVKKKVEAEPATPPQPEPVKKKVKKVAPVIEHAVEPNPAKSTAEPPKQSAESSTKTTKTSNNSKRKAKESDQEFSGGESVPESTVLPRHKRVKKTVAQPATAEITPPPWFQKYVEGVKKEQNLLKEEKVPMKKTKIEAQETAKKTWNDGFVRDRVTTEVDNHSNFFIT